MHEGAYKYVERIVAQLGPRQIRGRHVVELGSRTVAGDWPYSGPVRPLFDGAAYLGIDIAAGPNVDVVANAATWPEKGTAKVDTVVCCETLEHTPEAKQICANAHRLLTPGGVFIVTAAGSGRAPHSATDGGPVRDGEFYRNVTRDDLAGWLWEFEFTLIDDSTSGDIYAVAVK